MKIPNKTVVEISESSKGFISKIDGFEVEGVGSNLTSSLEDLILKIKTKDCESEEEVIKIYIQEKMPFAREVALDLYQQIGIEPMTLNNIAKITKQDKNQLQTKLLFIEQFGFAKHDNTAGGGCKWEIVVDKQSMIIHYINQANKFQTTVNYFNNLAETLKGIIEKENLKSENNG